MGRNVEKFRLDLEGFTGKWFVADEAGVSQLKRDIRIRAQKFLWLRKGEDFGAVIQMLLEAWNTSSMAIENVWNAYSSNLDYDLSNLTLKSLKDQDFGAWLAFYMAISAKQELLVNSSIAMEEILLKAKKWVKGIDVRILCCREETNLRAGLGWKTLGCEVRRYLDEKTAGSHRYYLSEREFAFFIRQPDKSFLGFHSEEPRTLEVLMLAFKDEWEANHC
jgi:hypothetical protein